jgi:hypothetical protein
MVFYYHFYPKRIIKTYSFYHQFLQLRKKRIFILLEQNMTSNSFNTPTLLWSQTPESVDISIRLSNIQDETVSCENNHFLFSCSSQSKNYRIEFDLDKSVEKVSYNKYDNRIAIVLQKADYEKWEFLTKVRGIYKNNIKIDWDKWEDSDAEEPEAPAENMGGSPLAPSSGFGGMDMDMMRQMMGGMDMDSMRQMMGGMNMGGEGEGDEGDGDDSEEQGQGEEEGEEYEQESCVYDE